MSEDCLSLLVIPRCADKCKDRLVLPWTPGVAGDRESIATLGKRLADAVA